MNNLTQTFVHHVEEEVRADQEEERSIFLRQVADQKESYEQKFHRFEILDQVFGEFLATNEHQGRQYTFDNIMDVEGEKFFRYEHASIPYLATIRRQQLYQGPCVDIKLANNGFIYVTKDGRHVRRHNSPHWVHLPSSRGLKYFDKLLQSTDGRFASVKTWYNYQAQRLDILFAPNSPHGVHLRVPFERGFPFIDDEVPFEPIPVSNL